jgi:cytochrome P450
MDQIHKDDAGFVNKSAYGVLGDTTGFAFGKQQGTIPTIEDGPVHDELRALYDTVLNHSTMAERSQKIISPICNWLIDRIERKLQRGEPVCLCLDLAIPLTYKALSTMLGVPHSYLSEFVRLGDLFFSSGVQPEKGAAAADELFSFFLAEVEKRKVEPKRDLLTYFLNATRDGVPALSPEAVAVTGRFVLIAGIDTTWRGLALVLAALLTHPDQFADVCENPQVLVRKAVEEAIRYAPSGFVVPRRVKKSMAVGGVEIPAGSHITTYQGVANRDPRRWVDPDRFNIHRPFKTNRTFGTGIHSCAGQHLARLEIITSVQLLAERLPKLRLAIAPECLEVRGLQIRVPRTVPVTLGK